MWPQKLDELVFKLPRLLRVWIQQGSWDLFIVWLLLAVISGEGVMWLKLTASSPDLAHGLTPWCLSWSLQPPPWHPKISVVLGHGGDARTMLGSQWGGLIPCLVPPHRTYDFSQKGQWKM